MPPSVLPSVATSTTGQNMAGFALTTANTAGSEPSGNRVAEMKLIRNTELSPTVGMARNFNSQRTADSIIGMKKEMEARRQGSIIIGATYRNDTVGHASPAAPPQHSTSSVIHRGPACRRNLIQPQSDHDDR